MQLTLIGGGCPDARPARYGSAYVLDTGTEKILVDCGPATTWKLSQAGLQPVQIRHLFLTHHHSDHNADVPCFILNWWDYDRDYTRPLCIYGPPPTVEFVDKLIGKDGAFRPDIESRIAHPASHWCHTQRGGVMPRREPQFGVRDLEDGESIVGDGWAATAAEGSHIEPTLVSMAYRFDASGGSIVFAGDCVDCPALRRLADGADTLVMACTHFDQLDRVVAQCIPGIGDVARVVREGRVKRVVLTHMSPPFDDPVQRQRALTEVQARVDKGVEVLCPDELGTVTL